MRDFMQLFREIFRTLYFVRGILLTFVTLFFIFAIIISHVENLPFGDALYFVSITALTIGYGDVTPQTPVGRILSIISGFFGLLFTGIVVAVSVHALTQAIRNKRAPRD